MSQLLKRLLAADRKKKLDAAFKVLPLKPITEVPAGVHLSGEQYYRMMNDPLAFAERYLGQKDEATGEFVPMKFSDADRYLFEQIEYASKNGLQLYDGGRPRRWPRYLAGIDSIDTDGKGTASNITMMRQARDGEEYHIIKHEPWEERLKQYPLTKTEAYPPVPVPGIGGSSFKITLNRGMFPPPSPPSVQMNDVLVPRRDIHFVRQEGDQIFLSVPYGKDRIELKFTDQPALWNMFPEIAKQLGKV